MPLPAPQDLIAFWNAAGPRAWFRTRPAFDAAIREQFEASHLAAASGALDSWGDTAEGALGLVLLLDQAPRNIYRGTARAYASDALALAAADRAIAAGFDQAAPAGLQVFFYLPFEHAEDALEQARSLALFEAHAQRTGDGRHLRTARIHADIIARFGRFPHRNAILGRETTPQEAAFLAGGGFRG